MPTVPRLIIEGACYHIMVRGNQKQKIFKLTNDLEVYRRLLIRYKTRFKIKLYGYCLMPNHIHLICQVLDKQSLSKFMHGLNRAYTAYFNDKHEKVGHLWQGRFKSKVISQDRYLLECINYVECNPVRANIVQNPHEYMWSSYRERNLFDLSHKLLDDIML